MHLENCNEKNVIFNETLILFFDVLVWYISVAAECNSLLALHHSVSFYLELDSFITAHVNFTVAKIRVLTLFYFTGKSRLFRL